MTEDAPAGPGDANIVRVRDYEFREPYVPTEDQLEQAEEVVFSDLLFSGLSEEDRRRNVVKLAMYGAASEWLVAAEEGAEQVQQIKMLGSVLMQVRATRQANGTIARSYEITGIGT